MTSPQHHPASKILAIAELIAWLSYAVLAALVMNYTIWYLDNPDAFQYLSIAEKYAAGHFNLAINAYWSPLLSWLLVPFLFLGQEGIESLKLLQVFLGLATLLSWSSLLRLFRLSIYYHLILLFAAIPFLLSYACLQSAADLLFLGILMMTLVICVQEPYSKGSKWKIVLPAIMGALLYLSKAFGAVLFIFLLLASAVYQIKMQKDRSAVRNHLLVLIVFFILISPWVILISLKQGHFSISDAARYNLTREVAPLPGEIKNLPVLSNQLLEPPDSLALSAWEAPGDVISLQPLRPFESASDRDHYLQLIKRNFLTIWYYDFHRQTGFCFLLIVVLSLVFLKHIRERFIRPEVYFSLAVIFGLYFGYSIILVHTRYIWMCTFLMLLLIGLCLNEWSNKIPSSRLFQVLFLMIALWAIKRPVKEVLFSEDREIKFFYFRKALAHPFLTMKINYQTDLQQSQLAEKIAELNLEPGRMASLKEYEIGRSSYSRACFQAYQLGWTFLGERDSFDIEYFQQKNVNYLLVGPAAKMNFAENDQVEKIFQDDVTKFSLFRMH